MTKSEEVSTNGMTYLLNEYELKDEHTGSAVFAMNPRAGDGQFRRVRSMMPFEYMDKMASDFKWSEYESKELDRGKKLANAFIINFQKFREAGKGLYIFSNTRGSGKTLLACCLSNEVTNRHDINVKFLSVLDYLDMTKKSYNSVADKEERESIMKAGILVLDDIGVEVSKDWVNTTLYQLINYRYSNRLITIFTSNVSIEELKVDGRIKDRINAMCLDIHMPEESVRSKLIQQGEAEFMKTIM